MRSILGAINTVVGGVVHAASGGWLCRICGKPIPAGSNGFALPEVHPRGQAMTVGAIAVPEHEDYVDREQLAQKMGVSLATLDRWVGEGMPSETWGLRARRFRPSKAIAWARARSHGEAGDLTP